MLCDKLVFGVQDERVKKRMLREPGILNAFQQMKIVKFISQVPFDINSLRPSDAYMRR